MSLLTIVSMVLNKKVTAIVKEKESEEAWIVAYDAGQIRYTWDGQSCERDGGRLYSENLY